MRLEKTLKKREGTVRMEITTKVLCKNGRHNRVFTDENGNLMIGECELDLPHYKPVGLVGCSSYYERRE